jgi:hypothetical protein
MALPRAAATRQLKHTRRLDVHVFARGDGLWEVDATISDTKTRDARMAASIRLAGEPIHDMLLRLVVDERFNIVEAGAQTRAMPYPDLCNAYGDAYGRLVGLNLLQGFRAALRERVTELAQILPTAVVQAFAGEVLDTRGEGAERPFQIDRCHALRADGEAVRNYYPRWYRSADAVDDNARSAPPAAG